MTISKINNDSVIYGIQTIPADGDFDNSQVSLYLDTTSKGLFAKWKDDTGTVRSRTVSTPSTVSTNQVLFAASDGTYTGDSDFLYNVAEKTLLVGSTHTVTTPGDDNVVFGSSHTIATGATRSQIACGLANSCSGQDAWVGGVDATVSHTGCFVWNSGTAFASTQANTVLFKSSNGMGITNSGASMTMDASALVQLDSTTRAFLPPRMTTVQRDAIVSPAEGLLLQNTTTNALNHYNGSAWGGFVSTTGTFGNNQVAYTDATGNLESGAEFQYIAAERAFLVGDSHTVTTPGDDNVVFGSSHTISTGATRSQIACGLSNSCSAQNAWLGGDDVTVTHDNTFTWSTGLPFASAQAGTVIFKTVAGMGVTDSGASMPITTDVLFQLDSTTQAFMPPRMTTVQRDALTASEGMQIHNATTNEPNFYNGSAWQSVVGIEGSIGNQQVGFGDGSGNLTSSANFTYDSILNNFSAGGANNAVTSTGDDNAVLGGNDNVISGTSNDSIILGGNNHTISTITNGENGLILSGNNCSISGDNYVSTVIIGSSLCNATATSILSGIYNSNQCDISGNCSESVIMASSTSDITGASSESVILASTNSNITSGAIRSVLLGAANTNVNSSASDVILMGSNITTTVSNVFVWSAAPSFSPSTGSGAYIASTVGLGISDASSLAIDSSALLQVDSTTKGVIFTPMTTAQRTGIASPATGLGVYDTDLATYMQYNGTAWENWGAPQTSTHTTTWSGIWGATTPSGDIKVEQDGNEVVLTFPTISVAATAAGSITIDTVLPAGLRPAATLVWPVRVEDNGTQVMGLIEILTDGTINWYASVASGNFAGSGNSGFSGTSVPYTTA